MAGTLPRTALRAAAIACALAAAVTLNSGTARADTILLQEVASGFTNPLGIVHAGDGSGRLFIVEQPGYVKISAGGAGPHQTFLDVHTLVVTGGERGLLGLAFDPDYENNGRFYINYTDLAGNTVIARYLVSADPDVADPDSAEILLTITQPYANHNGGDMHFGPDGYLYIASGDGGAGGDPDNRAQDVDTLLGKLLRIDVSGPSGYAIPPGNPFAGATPGADEIWALGLRNPWRFSFDRLTGDVFIGDVGQTAREEIDFQLAASAGRNYGWRLMEGTLCFNPTTNCDPGGLTDPILEYDHTSGNCSVTGGYRYRGASTGLYGHYVYGDYCTGRIWAASQSAGEWTSALAIDAPIQISAFGEDEDGELYVAGHGNGRIYQLLAPDTDADTVVDLVDNCVDIPNPLQENDDGNLIDMTPPKTYDDLTHARSDSLGNACDDDDDNDGLLDSEEDVFPMPACPSASAATSSVLRDSDGDRALDGAECARGTDPASGASRPPVASCGDKTDADNDGLIAQRENCFYNTNPDVVDTDGDGSTDGCEAASINQDTVVNVIDLQQVAQHLGTPYGIPGPPHLVNFDVTKDDGAVNIIDLQLVGRRFGLC